MTRFAGIRFASAEQFQNEIALLTRMRGNAGRLTMRREKATLVGLSAIVLWSSMVGLVRSVTQETGPVCGAAIIYSLSAILLFFTVGVPKLSTLPRRYVYLGGLLFAVYEISYSLALGYAVDSRQTIEVSMVNYLWPSLIILFAIVFDHQKSSLLVIPGLLLAFLGICWVLGGENGLDIPRMAANICANPLSYCLALNGAVLWALFCTVTRRIAGGKNAVTLFFTVTALILWAKFLSGGDVSVRVTGHVIVYALMAAAALGFGYAAWNVGILHGNAALMASASYFTPVLSAALSSVMLDTQLSVAFWKGALLVCAGSLLCWHATRTKAACNSSLPARPLRGRARARR